MSIQALNAWRQSVCPTYSLTSTQNSNRCHSMV